MAFCIFTDTSANLPDDVLRQRSIRLVPFPYYVNGAEFTCTETTAFDGRSFYNAMRGGADVTTSQISPATYRAAWEPVLQSGQDILFVGMSSGISGSYNCAGIAAVDLQEEYPLRTILVVDTLAASLGEGLQVLRAADWRDEGMSMKEIARRLTILRRHMCQIFTVDDLKYLKKSGRISNMAATVGTVLNIKPLLRGNEEGKIVSYQKCRGRRKALEALAERYEKQVADAEHQCIGIAHADCQEDVDFFIGLINAGKHPPKEILSVCYEPVTGSHVGPGTLALFFFGDDRVRYK